MCHSSPRGTAPPAPLAPAGVGADGRAVVMAALAKRARHGEITAALSPSRPGKWQRGIPGTVMQGVSWSLCRGVMQGGGVMQRGMRENS